MICFEILPKLSLCVDTPIISRVFLERGAARSIRVILLQWSESKAKSQVNEMLLSYLIPVRIVVRWSQTAARRFGRIQRRNGSTGVYVCAVCVCGMAFRYPVKADGDATF